MIKDYTHDYAAAAFMFYAECGCPSDEDVRKMLRGWAEKNHDSVELRNKRRKRRLLTVENLIEEKVSQIEQELACCIADIAAVNRTIEAIGELSMGDDKVKCIRYIYFCRGINLNSRGNMSALIRKCAVDTGMNESFIYRSLKQAREIFICKRGLRSDAPTEKTMEIFGVEG